MLKSNWSIYQNINTLSEHLASNILTVAHESIKLKGSFKVVLAGGTSLINTYKILSCADSDWKRWHVYIGDERCLPLKSEKRNDYMINKVWLNNGDIPRQNINLIRAELGPNDGAINYEKVINNVAYFDIVLLSMGEDGHTASLFPGHSYDENKMVVFEHNSPKYPKERISMSYSRLNQSKNVFKVVNGISKKKALDKWINGHKLPINKINGDLDKVFVCVS